MSVTKQRSKNIIVFTLESKNGVMTEIRARILVMLLLFSYAG